MTTVAGMEAEVTFSAACHGGPLGGQRVPYDTPIFLSADKTAGTLYVYQRQADGSYAVTTDHDSTLNYPHGVETGERALDWDRLPLSTDAIPVVSHGDDHQRFAGDPVDDGWDNTEETP